MRHLLQELHLATQAGNLVLDAGCLGFGEIASFAFSTVQRHEITHDAGVNLHHPLADLGHREVLVAVVHGFELAAIDRKNGTSEEFEPTAKLYELSAHRPDRLPFFELSCPRVFEF